MGTETFIKPTSFPQFSLPLEIQILIWRHAFAHIFTWRHLYAFRHPRPDPEFIPWSQREWITRFGDKEVVEIVSVVGLTVDITASCRMARLVGCEMLVEHLRMMERGLEGVKMALRGGEMDQLMEELEDRARTRVQGDDGGRWGN